MKKLLVIVLILTIGEQKTYSSGSNFHETILENTVLISEEPWNGIIVGIGTGFLIRDDKEKTYLVTARHVVFPSSNEYLYISKTIEKPNYLKKIDIKNFIISSDFDIAIALIDNATSSITTDILYRFKNRLIIDSFAIGYPKNPLEPIFRSGLFHFFDTNLEADVDMVTISGDSGGPVYSIEFGKILGIRVAVDSERQYGLVVPSNHILAMIRKQ